MSAQTPAAARGVTLVRRLLYIVAGRAYTDLRAQAWIQA